jgi:hypothetical protein
LIGVRVLIEKEHMNLDIEEEHAERGNTDEDGFEKDLGFKI